jgi:hypothetical protein
LVLNVDEIMTVPKDNCVSDDSFITQPKAYPRSSLPSIVEEESNSVPIGLETEWQEVPINSLVETHIKVTTNSTIITPKRILIGLFLFSQHELLMVMVSFVVNRTLFLSHFTFDVVRGFGYIYIFVGFLVLLKEMF